MKPLLSTLALAVLLLGFAAAGEPDDELADLPEKYRHWLALVDLLITDEERDYFLTLERDFRRDAFIDAFWAQRDPFEDTRWNELRSRWEERGEKALSDYGSLADDRSRVLLSNGEPINRCRHLHQELEVWFYAGSERADRDYVLIFERPTWKVPYRLYRPGRQLIRTVREQPIELSITEMCREETISTALDLIARDRYYEVLLNDILTPEQEPSEEWVATFAAQSTDLPADAAHFHAELAIDFPGSHQQRTVAQGVVSVPREGLGESGGVHRFQLVGEVVRDGELFERFRYRFEVPAEGEGPLALVFQRYFRPGELTVMVRLEDLLGRRFARFEERLEVPSLDGGEAGAAAVTAKLADSELFRLLAEADAATARGERVVRLLPPPGVVHTGLVRFKTLTAGDIDRVTFLLDDQPILTKNRPPFSVELDLGEVPGTHRLRAVAFGAGGEEAATDEILLNPGGQRFRVRLVEPRRGKTYRRSLRAVADLQVPDGEEIDRLELYVNEELAATLYQPPWAQPLLLPGETRADEAALAYVRAVAYLSDGNSSEDVVFVNAPDFIEEIEVQLVELYATVHDRAGRPVTGLGEEAFEVTEDGVRQEIRRFAWVSDLPLHTALLIDTSSSMEDSLERAGEAALAFVEQTVKPRDRAALITFTAEPYVAVRFTNDVDALAAALAAMRAEGGTALYDSLVFALHYFHGIKGQKALLLLSDGKDESSGFDFDGALQFARRAGVTLYTVGLKEASLNRGSRRVLRQLADETGGRSFFIDDVAELEAIYASIQQELRSQYLIAYQSSSARDESEFRRVEAVAEVDGEKLEVRTMSGYYP